MKVETFPIWSGPQLLRQAAGTAGAEGRIAAAPPAGTAAAAAGEFGRLLADAISRVEGVQQEAAGAATRLATGEVEDLSEVLIASEKATLALQLTIAVRNKVLEAYQEMMRMPV